MGIRVSLDDFNDVPSPGDVDVHGDLVTFTPLVNFISVEEESAKPLLGTSTETLLPADGMMLMYGDGGAGKTTLTIDAACHLGAGVPWLGISVERPVKITLIENEGPRGKFRQVLAEKSAAWNGGPAFQGNVTVLEEPWTRFTLLEESHRQALSTHVSQTATDLVVMGPLATLGMVGGGTPDEVSVFERLLRATRELISRSFAFWIVHHENKAGDVSGAWERVPDTLCHVQAQGNGHTLIHWRKARWSSESHGKSIELMWTAGRSFEVKEKPVRDLYEEMLEAFKEDNVWRTIKEAAKLIEIREGEAKSVLSALVRRGAMRFEIGPHGRHPTARCYRLEGAPDEWAHLGAPGLPGAGEGAPGPLPPPFREGESGAGTPGGGPEVRPEGWEQEAKDDIPF